MPLLFSDRKILLRAVLGAFTAVSASAQADDPSVGGRAAQTGARVEAEQAAVAPLFERPVNVTSELTTRLTTHLADAPAGTSGSASAATFHAKLMGWSSTSAACASSPTCGETVHSKLMGWGSPSDACATSSDCDGTIDDWLDDLDSDRPLLADFRNVCLGNGVTASVGGEARFRHMNEDMRLRPGGPARSTYDLWRIVPHLELKYGECITGYVQAIDASIFNEDLPVTAIDRNRADLLQYYVDVALGDVGCGTVHARGGRQFLKYGSQHLISPLAWGNTYRNFEGVKLYYTSDDWDIDGFWTQPVNGAAGNVFRPTSFDHPDVSRYFSGIYSTYKGLDNAVLDVYWLFLDEDNDKVNRIDGERHTIGARYDGKTVTKDCCGKVLNTVTFELEGAYQFGDSESFLSAVDEDIDAGMLHSSIGYTMNQVMWSPTIKGVFYWASGDDNPGDGENNNFNTLFPLGHAYWGILDNLDGSNLFDYSIQAIVKPSRKLTLLSAIHWFEKDESASPIFNVAGTPFPGGATTNGDKDIGSELDLIATYAHSELLQIQFGYSWFWYGEAVTQAAAPLPRGDASQLYFMTTYAF